MKTRHPGRRPQAKPIPFLATHSGGAVLCLGSLVLTSLIFEPIALWPAAFICLVPWVLFVGGSPHARRVYVYSFVLALVFYLINMRWLYFATGAGYVALSFYQAGYYPLAAIAIRHVIRRRHWPLAAALPVVWVGTEIVRAVFLTGFPWFFLSHSMYKVLSLIQVSDLVGAYGLSFIVAAINGAIADAAFVRLARTDLQGRLLPREVPLMPGIRPSMVRFSALFAGAPLVAAIIYGQIQLRRDTTTEGPRIAVIQGDFISTIHPDRTTTDHDRASEPGKKQTYFSMMRAAAEERPDLYLLPETPWQMYLNPEARDFFRFSRRSFADLQERARRHNAVVVTGSASLIPTPSDDPLHLLAEDRRHNSATVFTPDGVEPKRYDKVHLVPFGEYVPFRFGRFRFLYFWLNRVMPFSGPDGTYEFSLFPGESFKRFSMKAPSQDGREYRLAIPICYEDVMPYVSRVFVAGGADDKQVDFLLNISNDGWFGRGTQQPQHLAVCAFRAVENRVGIARAVNTGISGFVHPSGRVHDLVRGSPDTPWPGNCGYSVASVGVDSRFTLYSRYGDWFAWGCAALWLLLFLDYWTARARGLTVE